VRGGSSRRDNHGIGDIDIHNNGTASNNWLIATRDAICEEEEEEEEEEEKKETRGSKGKSHRGLAGHDQRATLAKQHYEALEEDRLIVSFACLLKERQKIKYDECGVTNKGNK